MEWLFNKVDIGGGPEIDGIVKAEFHYVLRISGMYPYLRNGLWIFSLLQLASYVTILSYSGYILVNTAIQGMEDLNLAADSIHYVLLSVIAVTIVLFPILNRNKFNRAMSIIGTGYYQYEQKFEIDELETWKNEMKTLKLKLFAFLSGLGIVVVAIGIGGPLTENYFGYKRRVIEGIDMRLPVPLWHPYSKEDPMVALAYTLLSFLVAILLAVIFISANVFYIFCLLGILFQYKILHKSIELLPQRAEIVYGKRYRNRSLVAEGVTRSANTRITKDRLKNCYNYCLAETVNHQLEIERMIKILQYGTRFPTGAGVILASIAIAISFLGLVLGDPAPSSMMLATFFVLVEILEMAVICYLGQQISDQNDILRNTIYGLNWYLYPKEVTKFLRIMLERSKRPIVLKAGELVPLNHAAFTNVMNSAYSYFNLLLAMHHKTQMK